MEKVCPIFLYYGKNNDRFSMKTVIKNFNLLENLDKEKILYMIKTKTIVVIQLI